jgi:hypothetical protein
MPLQPPLWQFGPPAYLPPQQLSFVQYLPYQQFQHLSFPLFAQPSQQFPQEGQQFLPNL